MSTVSRSHQLLAWSADTADALEAATLQLAQSLKHEPDQNLANVARRLATAPAEFAHRRAMVCRDIPDALAVLETRNPSRLLTRKQHEPAHPVAFMFPGIGDHYAGMARALYDTERVFRLHVDRSCEALAPHLGRDLREVLYGDDQPATPDESGIDLRAMLRRGARSSSQALLAQTDLAHPLVFVIEYALARLLLSWGIVPQAMIGYSLGEYVAACLAEVFSLEDALMLIARRARMIQELPAGAMLAIGLPEAEVRPRLNGTVSLAAVNAPSLCVVSGSVYAIEALAEQLGRRGLACKRLDADRPFHSILMEPIREPVIDLLRSIRLRPPRIRFVSNVTGTWITSEQASDPAYWAQHMCRPVRFGDGLTALLSDRRQILLEVGPGQSLGSFVKQQPAYNLEPAIPVLATLRYGYDRQSDVAFLLETVGKLWLMGVPIAWQSFYADALQPAHAGYDDPGG